MSDTKYNLALEVVRDAITEILTDRDQEVGELHQERALFAYAENVTDSLQLDSLDALDLIAIVEDRLGIDIPDDLNFEAIHTVGHLVALIAAR